MLLDKYNRNGSLSLPLFFFENILNTTFSFSVCHVMNCYQMEDWALTWKYTKHKHKQINLNSWTTSPTNSMYIEVEFNQIKHTGIFKAHFKLNFLKLNSQLNFPPN